MPRATGRSKLAARGPTGQIQQPMPRPPVTLFFDYVDPASFLQERVLERVLGPGDEVRRHPFEIQPPPQAMVDPEDPGWWSFWEAMVERGRGMGLRMTHPALTPWSRKAHELALHAREKGAFESVHRAIFRAHVQDGLDIGRVDVLVAIARDQGLDADEARTVLGVDRFLGPVRELRREAERLEVRGVPTVRAGGRRLEGFHDEPSVRNFLAELEEAEG